MLDALPETTLAAAAGTGDDHVLRALVARSATGLLALDGMGRVRIANAAALALLGAETITPGAPIGSVISAAEALAGNAAGIFAAWLRNGAEAETYLTRVDGRVLTVAGSSGPDGHVLLTMALEEGGTVPPNRRDPLTGLADRAWLLERLGALLAEPSAQVALLIVDLDRFKAVNDTRGHPVGDALLCLVAKRLRNALRQTDLICRYAGDEFAIVLPRCTDPSSVARKLIASLSRPYLIEGALSSIGASIGAARAPDHGESVAELVRAADIALYAAKADGRGVERLFDTGLDGAARRRHALAEALRRAVPLGQLELHYQPQMVLGSRTLTGFEALVRWRHPEYGLVGPDDFIPHAEESGLIWTIGDWVLRTACEEATNWPPHLTVSVNISGKQLLDRNRLARTVKSTLLRTALAPHRLELEISESALAREDESFPVLNAIRALGVHVSVDDFGTGCSSLAQLSRFPFSKIKIDGSFIRALGTSHEATGVVRAIAALGQSLGITTIAEGVETKDQESHLVNDGCAEMQGFLIGHPVPSSEIISVIATFPTAAPDI